MATVWFDSPDHARIIRGNTTQWVYMEIKVEAPDGSTTTISVSNTGQI